ncbi:MAG: hypothetical protein JXR69_09015 [Candidatus Delongbacteria bacterium]|nr:hypothetical protein [Candidatus Delongbacteria bacterium]
MFKFNKNSIIGTLLIGYSIYDEIVLFINKISLDKIKDIPSGDFPIMFMSLLNVCIFTAGIIFIRRSTKRANKSD